MTKSKQREAFEAHFAESVSSSARVYLADEVDAALAQKEAQPVEPVEYLANGTRFKMSFFRNIDDSGNRTDGTHVMCFEGFERELDGRWVALVAAEDDCHLKHTAPVTHTALLREALEALEAATPYVGHHYTVAHTSQLLAAAIAKLRAVPGVCK